MEPIFIVTYHHELGEHLNVCNNEGKCHIIKYNKDLIYPLITTGLNDLKAFYNIQDNVKIVLSYFGNDLFQIKSFTPRDSTSSIPSFHSRNTDHSKSFIYDFTLPTNKNIDGYLVSTLYFISFYILNNLHLFFQHFNINILSILQILPPALSYYIKQKNTDNYITLCGDDGQKQHFQIMKNNYVETTIGGNWDHFCFKNGLQEGCQIQFKFALQDLFFKCRVFNLSLA